MRKVLLAAATASILSGLHTLGHAQTPVPPVPQGPVATSHKLNLTLEQRYVIKENIKDLKTESANADFQPAVGDPVPANVKLQPVPAEIAQKVPQVKTHVFFITGEQIVLVDPKDNKVAEIIRLGAD